MARFALSLNEEYIQFVDNLAHLWKCTKSEAIRRVLSDTEEWKEGFAGKVKDYDDDL